MLSGGELRDLYAKDFIVVETEALRRNRDEDARQLTSARYTPNFVFLDSKGNKVLETRGFNNVREAKALHEFVSKQRYRSQGYAEFLASYPWD